MKGIRKGGTYLIDTNVLLFDPQALGGFHEASLVMPLEVLGDLDRFKHGTDERARNARSVALALDRLRAKGSLGRGVDIGNGSVLRIESGGSGDLKSDEALLALAMKARDAGGHAVIVTKSVNLRVKADAMGLEAVDYGQETSLDAEAPKGWRRLSLSSEQVSLLREGRSLDAGGLGFHENEYALVLEEGGTRNGCCARYNEGRGLAPLPGGARRCCGVGSLNVEQAFAMDALLDRDIKLVTLAGRAGTGKTLLAMAAALQQIFDERLYSRLLVFRPTMPVSRDLGYLPGDVNDKMRPWMQPVYDALELIRSLDRQSSSRKLPNDLLACPEISVEPLTYIRGRSIPNQFIIIDEAQNLTPLEVKTAITRVGNGSKIVLTGDPAQIDNPYVDSRSNGLSRLVVKFLGNPLAAHVTLVKGERSELAETAARLL